MKHLKILVITTFLFLSSFAYAQQDQTNSVTMEQFIEKMKTDKDLIVLDVRTPEEVTAGKIENAINIPVQVLEERINELKPYKNKEILVICRTQNRSAAAVSILNDKGYKAKYILGGMSVYNQK